MNKITLNGGVLIIGSLYWEDSDLRKKWRNEFIDFPNYQHIALPIRYGRISNTRNCTYTMVYSSDCKPVQQIGQGLVVPFRGNPVDTQELERQTKMMIDAEHNTTVDFDRYNWSWGALGIAVNPKWNAETAANLEMKRQLLASWSTHFGKGFNTEEYRVGNEEPILSKKGELLIDWKEEMNDFDFVIGTAVKPELKNYPDPTQIVVRMKVNEYDTYFNKNTESGIMTFQDTSIRELLENK